MNRKHKQSNEIWKENDIGKRMRCSNSIDGLGFHCTLLEFQTYVEYPFLCQLENGEERRFKYIWRDGGFY